MPAGQNPARAVMRHFGQLLAPEHGPFDEAATPRRLPSSRIWAQPRPTMSRTQLGFLYPDDTWNLMINRLYRCGHSPRDYCLYGVHLQGGDDRLRGCLFLITCGQEYRWRNADAGVIYQRPFTGDIADE